MQTLQQTTLSSIPRFLLLISLLGIHSADYGQSYAPEVKQEANQFDSIYAPGAIPFLSRLRMLLLILTKEVDCLIDNDHLTHLKNTDF